MPKSVNILGFYVSDVAKTVEFYTKLGFQKVKEDKTSAEVYLGQVKFHFVDKETARSQDESFQKDAFGEPKGTGLYINVEVQNIDEYHRTILDKGLVPSTKPRDWPWGHREFVIRDPDRYKLVFYQKLN